MIQALYFLTTGEVSVIFSTVIDEVSMATIAIAAGCEIGSVILSSSDLTTRLTGSAAAGGLVVTGSAC